MQYAKNKDLVKFKKLLKQIESVNDNIIYECGKTGVTRCCEGKDTRNIFIVKQKKAPIEQVTTVINRRTLSREEIPLYEEFTDNIFKNLLRKICSVLGDDYPQFAKKSIFRKLFHKPIKPDSWKL